MVIEHGAVHWADLGAAKGSAPAKRRPVLVVQSDSFNRSRIATVIVAVITSNTLLAERPGNVFLPTSASGLPKDAVVNVSALTTIDRSMLGDPVSTLPAHLLDAVDAGLRTVLAL